MSQFLLRIKRRLKMTVNDFRDDCRISSKYAWYRVGDNLLGRVGFSKASQHFHEKKVNFEIYLLESILSELITKYKDFENEGNYCENAPIWVCWWTGIESAPSIVKQCVKSIENQSGSHPVIIITEENYSSYLDVPSFILNKMRDGSMGLAHFAENLRVCLLKKYGGLWLDATIYCADSIPEWYFELPFFTCKSEFMESKYISHYQWVTFCLGGWKGNVIYSFLQEAFECYWKNNDCAIDYLLFDDLIWIAREHIPAIRKMMKNVPLNTPHRDDLQAAFNANLPAEAFKSVIYSDTPIYKLSWREKYSETTGDGRESVFGCDFVKTIKQR